MKLFVFWIVNKNILNFIFGKLKRKEKNAGYTRLVGRAETNTKDIV